MRRNENGIHTSSMPSIKNVNKGTDKIHVRKNRANRCGEGFKIGQIIIIYRKMAASTIGTILKGVGLLAMGSKIVARITASRVRWWSEHMGQ